MKTCRVGIVTINDNRNLGNRLQNFAVQEIVKRVSPGAIVETIKNTNRKERGETLIVRVKNLLRDYKYYNRTINFRSFNKNITFSKHAYDAANDNRKLGDKYDYFLVGSDQVWNPNYGWLNSIDLLSFAKNKKRISISASYGVSEIPEEYKTNAANELKKFKMISVREDKGKELTEKITSRKDVEVLVDPTMLLSADDWNRFAKKPKALRSAKPIVLKYFLGGLSKEKDEIIQKIADENNCQVIDVFDKSSRFYACGPSEFLYLEKNAFLICTDSFHSSVFAIINERPFVIFDRQGNHAKMNSRLETLISKFELKDRWFNGETISNKNLSVDYSKAKIILKKEQEKAIKFLKKALDIKDEK